MLAGRDSEGIRTMGEMTALHFEIFLQNFVRGGTNSMTRLKGTPVTPRLLQAVLRSFADIGPPVSDKELLRRFIQGDQQTFAELVRRHGRLVWAACRNLTRSEADA